MEYVSQMYATFWALVPPIVAIGLALITKEVYSSLFVGIVIGGLFYSNFGLELTMKHVFQDGIVGVLSKPDNVGISGCIRNYGLYDEYGRWIGSIWAMGIYAY